MNVTWQQFVMSLRAEETSGAFSRLVCDIGEKAEISDTPEDYNDPEGRTRFYKFLRSGIEIGFRARGLNHVHFFTRPDEAYDAYRGPLEDNVGSDQGEAGIRNILGDPGAHGGGKAGALLGFRHKWIKYGRVDYSVRYEFEAGGGIRKITLIAD
jgi:hypothetical protein